MRRLSHKLIYPILFTLAIALFSGIRPVHAAVADDQVNGTYADDFSDATGIASTVDAGVDIADGTIKLKNAGGTYTAPFLANGSVTLNVFRPLRVAAFGALDIVASIPAGTSVRVQIMDDGGALYRDTYVPGNSSGIASFPVDLSTVPFFQCGDDYAPGFPPPYITCDKVGAITVRLLLSTSDAGLTPSVDSFSLSWTTFRGSTAASPIGDMPWPAAAGDMLGSSRSSYGSSAVYPAFRWVGPAVEGAYALPGQRSTLATDNAVIYPSSYYAGYLISSDMSDGSENWRLPFLGYINGGLITQNGTLYGTDIITDLFYAIDIATGQIKWTYNFVGGHGNSQVVINADGSRIYTVRNNGALVNTVYIFGPDGTLLNTSAITAPSGVSANPTKMVVSPIDGTLYFGTSVRGAGGGSTDTGKLYALDPDDGSVIWSYDIGDVDLYTGPMVGADGTIYVGKSFFSKDFPIKMYAINPGVAPAERVKWVRDYGTGDMGIRQIALRSDGNLWIKYHLTRDSAVRILALNASDGSDLATPLDGALIWDPITSLGGGGFLSYGSGYGDSSTVYKEVLSVYDNDFDLKWNIDYTYDSIDDSVFYYISQPVVGANGWLFSTLGKNVIDESYNEFPDQEYLQPFAMAPWTLVPSSDKSTYYEGETVRFSVATSMQEHNPLTSEDNKMQVVFDNGIKVPLSYSSTNGQGDTVWTADYALPADFGSGTHTYSVQAAQPMVKTDITTAFASAPAGSDNTGLTAAGTLTFVRHAAGSSGGSGGSAYVAPAPSLTVTIPSSGATLAGGSTVGIAWSSANGSFVKYRVSYSADNGNTWTVLTPDATSNSYSWTVPETSTTQGYIKVEGLDATGAVLASDTNDAVFMINGAIPAPAPVAAPSSPASTGASGAGEYDPVAELAASPDINTDLGLKPTDGVPFCTSGSLIKGTAFSAVYYCGADGKRYVFPNPGVFFSWYPDFSTVQTITDDQLINAPLGGNVTYRPGTRLVKIQTDPKVYAVSKGGVLRWVTTEDKTQELYGADWSKKVVDVPDAFFADYEIGEAITK